MESILNKEQSDWLSAHGIPVKRFKGYDQWHKSFCPNCKGNLSVIFDMKGGVYAQCWSAKCETKFTPN